MIRPVTEVNSAVVRQTTVITGDVNVSRHIWHVRERAFHPILTGISSSLFKRSEDIALEVGLVLHTPTITVY